MSSLQTFLEAVATDPILVDQFRADPDRVLDRYEIDESLRPLIKSGDDVALLTAVLDARAEPGRAKRSADEDSPGAG